MLRHSNGLCEVVLKMDEPLPPEYRDEPCWVFYRGDERRIALIKNGPHPNPKERDDGSYFDKGVREWFQRNKYGLERNVWGDIYFIWLSAIEPWGDEELSP